METFEFSIVASGLDHTADDFEIRFFDAGCDDAVISFQKGHIIIDFAREAETIEDAISSAVQNVRAAGATIDRVEPDPLVSLSDIAERAGLSRAAVSLYAKGERGKGFPAPVARITSESPLWDWGTVATWLYRQKRISKESAVAAETLRLANEHLRDGEPVEATLRAEVASYTRSLEAA